MIPHRAKFLGTEPVRPNLRISRCADGVPYELPPVERRGWVVRAWEWVVGVVFE